MVTVCVICSKPRAGAEKRWWPSAARLAAEADRFLDEYGGTGDGVVGALASVGLTATGDDGRFIAYGRIREYGECVSVETRCDDDIEVVDENGRPR